MKMSSRSQRILEMVKMQGSTEEANAGSETENSEKCFEDDTISYETSSLLEPVISQNNGNQEVYVYELVSDQIIHNENINNVYSYYLPSEQNNNIFECEPKSLNEVVVEEVTNENRNDLRLQSDSVTEMGSTNNSSPDEDDISEYKPNNSESESDDSISSVSLRNLKPVDRTPPNSNESDFTVATGKDGEDKGLKRKREVLPRQENTKKRKRDPSTWKRNIQKAKMRSGREYINKSGKVVKAKKMKPGCREFCRKKCTSKLAEEQRLHIFQKFWSMGDYNRQSAFVGSCVHRIPKKRISVKENDEPSRRSSSLSYTLPKNALEKIEVCKTMFLNTLSITDMWVMTALKKIDNSATSTVTPDKRGKHSNRTFIIPEVIKRSVRQHIELFPKVPSHYCRERTNKLYVEEGLTIAKMYRLYKTWAAENDNVLTASERQYRDIFNTEFNIGFYKPKKDKCDICNKFEISEEKTPEVIEKQNKHLARKELVRKKKEEDKNEAKVNNSLCVSCFDLQKVIQIPQSNSSHFYYKCKLSVFNFTIFDLASKEGFCQIWHEAIGKRGANEISSCLYLYLIEMIKRGKNKFIFYSDNCVGQNKNKVLVSMYSYVAKRHAVSIIHRFLEQGHTQNENDSVHALIEKNKRHVDLFTPDQFIILVKMAKVQGKPNNVKELSQDDIFDFKRISNSFKNFNKNTKGEKIVWNNITEIIVEAENSELIGFKYELDENPYFIDFNQAKKTRGSSSLTQNDIVLHKSYNNLLPLPKKKYEHLQYLKNKLPETYRYFYESLTCNNEEESDLDSE